MGKVLAKNRDIERALMGHIFRNVLRYLPMVDVFFLFLTTVIVLSIEIFHLLWVLILLFLILLESAHESIG